MDKEYALDTAQKITAVIEALKSGMLKIRQVDEAWARELLAAPRGPTGLFDISKLSSHAVGTARATALGLQHFAQQREDAPADAARDPSEAQCQLFHFFSNLFEALTGAPPEVVDSVDEVRDRMLDRVRHDSAAFASSVDSSTSELFDFYRSEASALFNVAKRLGGMKAVLGGQRQFGISALESTRISGLYLDTQLIPDPVYPFLTGNLHLNAAKLQLAHVLYYILALRPLVDARLPEPLIFVFPSFEENLEERDAITQAGIADLLLKLVTPICKAPLANVEELYDYARREEASFLAEAMKNRLFVPPGGSPTITMDWQTAVAAYLSSMQGVRTKEVVAQLSTLPAGVLLLNGILERLRPQYHLLENADELDAQPLLSQPVHWHYFEMCAGANARELINQRVISEQSLITLRAMHDDSLTWLGNVPIEGLVDLRRNMEHSALREELKKYTAQLASAGPLELGDVVRNVNHGLQALIQRQQKAIGDIQDKYAPKKWGAYAGAAVGAATGAAMYFMPSLSAAIGASAPVVSVIGAVGGGGLSYIREKAGEMADKRRAKRTMLGMLASAHSTR